MAGERKLFIQVIDGDGNSFAQKTLPLEAIGGALNVHTDGDAAWLEFKPDESAQAMLVTHVPN